MPESSPVVARRIEAITREDEAAVVVSLDCGHQRHVRHHPPLSENPWVLDDALCERRRGGPLECHACAQRSLPEGARRYRSTPSFDDSSIPAGLLGEHSTKDGVWGRLVVEQGELWVDFALPLSTSVHGTTDEPIVIPPSIVHRVRLAGPARFRVDFLRVEAPAG